MNPGPYSASPSIFGSVISIMQMQMEMNPISIEYANANFGFSKVKPSISPAKKGISTSIRMPVAEPNSVQRSS